MDTASFSRYWLPQPGPQAEVWTCPVDEIFFGGTRGGAKTDTVIGRHIRGAEKYGIQWNGLIARRKYKEFGEMRRRWDELILSGLPAVRIGGEESVNYIRFKNGAVVTLMAFMFLEIVNSLLGHQFTEISIEEAPTIPFIAQLVDRLKGSMRSPHGIPCRMILTGNPGGPGASSIKAMYIPRSEGGEVDAEEGEVRRMVTRLANGQEVVFTRIFIRSTLWDNKILIEKDPFYEARLRSINDPLLVKAWLDGRWDIFVGQAFNFYDRHIIKPIWPIPENAPIYMTMDWGFGKPFSIGWWWVDGEDRIYRFAEWYGWDKVTPNTGLRLTDAEIAEGVVEREKTMGIWGREITRLAGPDCFNKKPDYKGGGQGPTTSDEFLAHQKKLVAAGDVKANLRMRPGDTKRELKIKQFRNRLRVPEHPDEMPMMVVYNTCRQFIRIIPDLCVDDLTGEYLEPLQELHPFDESCHICMARPMGFHIPEITEVERLRQKAKEMKEIDNASFAASMEWAETVEMIKKAEEELEDYL